MTLRLVALMSVVLLLSLAAFGLAANHYQKQVIREVERTASHVGRAALSTLDWKFGPHLVSELPVMETGSQTWTWKEGEAGVGEQRVALGESRVIVVNRFVSHSYGDAVAEPGGSGVIVRCEATDQEVTDCVARIELECFLQVQQRLLGL